MTSQIRPLYLPPVFQDAVSAGRVILRDGGTASLRAATADDVPALQAFFEGLSDESNRRRFFSAARPNTDWIRGLCQPTDPREQLTLLILREADGKPRVLAVGSYLPAERKHAAEVAMAVADEFRGKGLGTLLLERLALIAVRHGIEHFLAVTQSDNRPMINVFRESGLELREELAKGYLEVDLSILPSEQSVARTETRDRVATAASLRPFFQPRAVAVVGASRDQTSIGARLLNALLESHFNGPIYPINPKAPTLNGLRAYPSVRDLPGPVDLAVIAVPAAAVPAVVEDCAASGVRALVVITAGFAEVGAEGREQQRKLAEQVRGHGMRLIGPNCLGLMNTDPAVRLNASFSPIYPAAGRIAMSSQSGALGLAVLAAAQRLGLGLSTFVSVGNKADVSGNDLLQYWEEDDNTAVILLYLESFGNPRRFARIAPRVGRRKPIVAVKSGRSAAGRRAAGSHTAALAASDTAVDALFRQAGVIRADTLEEMFDLAAALSDQPLPPGRRVAVVTNAGGPGILCADACEAGGLVLPELPQTTRTELAAFLPGAASLGNPVDMIASASPEQYGRAVETLLTSEAVDALIVMYVPVGLAETQTVAAAIAAGVRAARATTGAGKPVLNVLMSSDEAEPALPGLEHFPRYAFPEAAARVLAKTAAYAEWRRRPPGVVLDFLDADSDKARSICEGALAEHGAGWLPVEQSWQVLEAMRLPVLPGASARTAEEAAAAARQIGFPVAVKLTSRRLVHKTEVGGVVLNLADEPAVRQAFADIQQRLIQTHQLDAMDGVYVQAMAPPGTEVMVGVTADPLFGPLVAFGLGGINVEVLGDVCFRITPLTDRDAAEMVRSIRGYRLLEGYRGRPAADVPALETLLARVARLIEAVPVIAELDLNPIVALPSGQGCRIADVRINLQTERRP